MLARDKPSAADRVVIALATVIGVIVLIVAGFFGLIAGVSYYDDWNYDRQRVKVNAELVKLGLPDSPPDDGPHARRPDLTFPSPNGAWTLVAQWVDVRGYNWGVRNNQTGKTYLNVEKIEPNTWFSAHLAVLWSPDSRYVAVNTDLGVEVAQTLGEDAVDTNLVLGADDWERKALLNAADQPQFEGSCGGAMRGLRWVSPNQLAVETYIAVRIKSDDSERAVAAHLVLQFEGEKFTPLSKDYDFYETLPPPD